MEPATPTDHELCEDNDASVDDVRRAAASASRDTYHSDKSVEELVAYDDVRRAAASTGRDTPHSDTESVEELVAYDDERRPDRENDPSRVGGWEHRVSWADMDPEIAAAHKKVHAMMTDPRWNELGLSELAPKVVAVEELEHKQQMP